MRNLFGQLASHLMMLRRDMTALIADAPGEASGAVRVRNYRIARNGDALIPASAPKTPDWANAQATMTAFETLITVAGDKWLIVVESGDEPGMGKVNAGGESVTVEVVDVERRDSLITLFGNGAILSKRGPAAFHGMLLSDKDSIIRLGDMYVKDMASWRVGTYSPVLHYAVHQADIASTFRQSFNYATGTMDIDADVAAIIRAYVGGETPRVPAMLIQHITRGVWDNPRKFMFGGKSIDDDGWDKEAARFYKALAEWADENDIPIERLLIMIDEPKIDYRQVCAQPRPDCWALTGGGGKPYERMRKLVNVARAAGFPVGPATMGGVSLKLCRDGWNANQFWFVGDPRKRKYWYRYDPARDVPKSEEKHGLYHVDFAGYRPHGNPADIFQLGLTCWLHNLNSLLYWSVLDFRDPPQTNNVWTKPTRDWYLNLYWPPAVEDVPGGIVGFVVPSIRLAYIQEAVRLNSIARAAEAKVGREKMDNIIGMCAGRDGVWGWSPNTTDYLELEDELMSIITQQTSMPVPPSPPPESGWQYGFYLGNTAGHDLDVDNLAQYSVVEIQFGLDDCIEDRSGRQFTPDGTPIGEYLRKRNVYVSHYVAPFVAPRIDSVGTPPDGREGPGRDPYWLMLEIAKAADKYNWWLPCRDGNLKPAFRWRHSELFPLDTTRKDYRDWFVETVTKYRGDRRVLRFDHGFTGFELIQYLKCDLSVHPIEWTQGQYDFYDALRSEGWRIIVNQGWVPKNPREAPERWQLPILHHVDGVMAELAGAVYVDEDIRWLAMTDSRRRALAHICNNAGKAFVAWASWKEKRNLGFHDYDSFLRYHIGEAKQHRYRLAIHNADVSSQRSVWSQEFGIEKPAPLFGPIAPSPHPTPPSPPSEMKEQLQALEKQVMRLQKQSRAMDEQLQEIITWITSFGGKTK